jgi:DNA-binding transcriptional LysR family regulator
MATKITEGDDTMRRDIDMRALRSLVAVVDHGGFSRAALRLNRTQSGVSMQLRRLEATLGVKIFARTRGEIVLSREGLELLDAARRIVALNDRALARLPSHAVAGRVRLGVMEDVAAEVLPAMLAGFMERHPAVEVEVSTGLTALMREDLGVRYDLLLLMQPAGAGHGEVLMQDRAAWAAAPSVATPLQRPLPLVLSPDGCLFRAWAVSALETAGLDWRPVLVSYSHATIAAAVRAGLGVSVVKRALLPGGLVEVSGLPALPELEIVLCRADLGRAAAGDALARHLVESFGQRSEPARSPTFAAQDAGRLYLPERKKSQKPQAVRPAASQNHKPPGS